MGWEFSTMAYVPTWDPGHHIRMPSLSPGYSASDPASCSCAAGKKAEDDGSSTCVPTTHMGDSWLLPGSALSTRDNWAVSQ